MLPLVHGWWYLWNKNINLNRNLTLWEFILLAKLVNLLIMFHTYFTASACIPRQDITALTSLNYFGLSIVVIPAAVMLNSAFPCIPSEIMIMSTFLPYSPLNMCTVRWFSLLIMCANW